MDNPYQSPSSVQLAAPSIGEVDSDVIRILSGTKGWARFLAILGFLLCALLVLVAFTTFLTFRKLTVLSPSFLVGIGGLYLVMAAAYFFAALKLNQYASRIGDLVLSPSQMNLVAALDAQRGFWKYVGIMAILLIVLYIVGTLFAAVA